MDLRAKLAIALLILLVVPFVVVTTVQVDRTMTVMARDLDDSGNVLINRTFDFSNRPAAVIRVGLSTALIGDEARRSIAALVIAGAVGAAIAVIGAIILGAILLGPIVDITAGVENIVAGRDEVKIRVEGRNELSTLAERFNELSNRIKASRDEWETERGQFFNIFRSITDAVVLLDSNGAVLFANEEAQHRLGLPAGGQSEGKPLRMLVDA